MTKDLFIRTYAEENEISIKQAKEEVNRFLTHLETTTAKLNDNESLTLTGSLKVTVKAVAEREARNPKTGEKINLPATRKVSLTPMANLKQAVL